VKKRPALPSEEIFYPERQPAHFFLLGFFLKYRFETVRVF
jgi:hypothetical protein